MMEKTYNIFMHTPLGKKKGTLTASIKGDMLSGWLDILEHRQPFEGTVDEAGNCQISGSFVTLMRTVSYIAAGKITSSSVNLQMKGERNVFEVSGIVCPESEER